MLTLEPEVVKRMPVLPMRVLCIDLRTECYPGNLNPMQVCVLVRLPGYHWGIPWVTMTSFSHTCSYADRIIVTYTGYSPMVPRQSQSCAGLCTCMIAWVPFGNTLGDIPPPPPPFSIRYVCYSLVGTGVVEFMEHLKTPPDSDPITNKLWSSDT